MSAGSNPNLTGIVGSIQQNNAMAAYNRHVSRPLPDSRSWSPKALEGSVAAKETYDSASISRGGMAALETARKIDDETVIRDQRSADRALASTRDQIIQEPERAVRVQANQTAEQLLELYGQQG
jgi:hypothetical protein